MVRASYALEDATRWLLPLGLAVTLVWFFCTTAFADPSPTGRTPKLFWTPERQAVWDQMRAANHPWWQQIKANADLSGTSNSRYADMGQWATMAYQVTGDPTYVAKAWAEASLLLKGAKQPDPSRNFTREYFTEFAWMYDWLYPGLTAAQRQQWIDSLNYWSDLCLNNITSVPWGTRLSDSDETTGHYFGIVLWALASAGDNSRANEFLTSSQVGGFDQTSTSRNTMRNAISDFIRRASGGVWLEGTEYNLGTLQLLFMGADGLRTATGSEKFPEMDAFRRDVALAQLHELTPNLDRSFQWGDSEEPHGLKRDRRLRLLNMLAGLLQGDAVLGPAMRSAADLLQSTVEPHFRWAILGNPYASATNFRPGLAKGYAVPGMGLLFFHDGWSANQSLFGSHLSPRTTVDHEPHYFSNFELYRNGEFVITHVTGYDANEAEHHNSMLLSGLSVMDEARGPIGAEFGTDYAYHVGSTGGNRYATTYYNPPPRFLHEWTRSLLYLPSTDAQHDTIVVFDRVNAEDPKTLVKLSSYSASDLSRINGAQGLKQWIMHTPVSPTMTANAVSWQTAGGQAVRVQTLLPSDQTRAVYDDASLGLKGTIVSSELKFQVRIRPGTDRRWDTFLNVVQASNPGVTLTNTLVSSTNGAAQGALIRRPNHSDVLALFNATQGPDLPATKTANNYLQVDTTLLSRLNANRLLASGYTVTWSAVASSTTVFLADLNPATQWFAAVDGQPEAALTVSPQGLARLPVSGAGSHTLIVRAAGAATDTTAPTISGVAVSNVTATGATITWNTNEPSAGQVDYGVTSSYGSQTTLSALGGTSQLAALSGLAVDTVYHFRVRAVDAAGNASVSADGTFQTAVAVTPDPTPPPATGLITNVQAKSGKTFPVDVFGEGCLKYMDRTTTFGGIPAAYLGQSYIRTANDDKYMTDADYLRFTLTQDAMVYVPYDSNATVRPAWLDGSWTDTGDAASGRRFYKKFFPAGPVVLGGNAMAPESGVTSNYNVLAIPAVAAPAANQPPVLAAIGPQTVTVGQTLHLTLSATDPDGDPLAFSALGLPSGAALSGADVTWTPTSSQAGTVTITFSVSDGSLSDSEAVAVTVLPPANGAPVLDSIGAKTAVEGARLIFSLSASDPDGDPLTFSASGLPAGASFNSGIFDWTPDYDQAGAYPVTFTVSDGTLAASEAVTITVADTNRPPVLVPITVPSVAERQLLTLTLSGSDPDGDVLVFSASGLPAGAVLAGSTLTWTPDYDQAGAYPVTFTVSDGTLTANQAVSVTVTNTNRPPVANAGVAQTVTAGSAVTLDGTGSSDPDGDPLAYAWQQTAGPTAALNLAVPSRPTFTAPLVTTATDVAFTLSVSDGESTSTATVTVTVQPVAPVPAPVTSLILNSVTTTGRLLPTGSLAVGAKAYIDRAYTFTVFPGTYTGAATILTANDDKAVNTNPYLTFTLAAPATVYVAFDARSTQLPAWLDKPSWVKTGEQLKTSDTTFWIYRKAFQAGTVTMGSNNMWPQRKAQSHYLVFAMPQ